LEGGGAAAAPTHPYRRTVLTAVATVLTLSAWLTGPAPAQQSSKWAASWSTSIQSAYVAPTTPQTAAVSAYNPQPDLTFALPNATTAGADNQTFRMIIKPDLWSDTVRVRFSNAFGTKPVVFSDAAVALQDYQANLVQNTSATLTFGGAHSVTIPPGAQTFSDPVHLPFVTATQNLPDDLRGRNLAVSFAVQGTTGPASYHATAFTTSYISPPNSGDVVSANDDTSYPYSTTSFFFVSELDALVPSDTIVVCAFGDSITDGTFSTINGNDRWSNVLSRQLHDKLGGQVSVVNEGIGGNGVAATLTGQPATERVSRDVVGLSGLDLVVWMEGINDLGNAKSTPDTVIAGYRQVVGTLHNAGVAVIGATVTSALLPGGQVPGNSPLAANTTGEIAASYGSAQTDAYRQQLNTFILTSGLFDATADFAAVTADPNTGTLRAPFVPNSEGSAGDYLHPNRAGYQAMGQSAAAAVLSLISGKR
ncbi:MAG: GDSL-type esterase/lipase family protein, partial [Pseudomonadota bacterium]|nr:GDSL-type esterase/lipase family protein [Pseudomonadota bacterium]